MKQLFISLIVLLIGVEAPAQGTYKPVVVLELFTSQGCSSCPPADALLDSVKKKHGSGDVIALSYHVDYWNYIGWKDPFSKTDYSNKQRQYGQKFNNSSIYTPQMVINGKAHFVGSNERVLNSNIQSYSNNKAQNKVSISNVKNDGTTISFDYTIEGGITKKQLRIALVIDERITNISRGENRNKSLKNANIVIAQTEIKLNSKSGKASINIPDIVTKSDQLSLITLIETADLDIVGGIQVKL